MNYFCDVENREPKEIVDGVLIRTFWQNEMLLSVVDLAANAIVPMHNHSEEQSGTIISGVLTLTIGGEEKTLTSGDCYIIPGGVDHQAVAGPDGAHVVDIFSPVRESYKY